MVAEALAELWPQYRIFALSGELGAGKTTLSVSLAKALGYEGHVSSPTFALVNTYESGNDTKPTILHFDLYRLGGGAHSTESEEQAVIEEAYEAGLVELLAGEVVCLVEWPERAPSLLAPYAGEALWVRLDVINDNQVGHIETRELSVFARGGDTQ